MPTQKQQTYLEYVDNIQKSMAPFNRTYKFEHQNPTFEERKGMIDALHAVNPELFNTYKQVNAARQEELLNTIAFNMDEYTQNPRDEMSNAELPYSAYVPFGAEYSYGLPGDSQVKGGNIFGEYSPGNGRIAIPGAQLSPAETRIQSTNPEQQIPNTLWHEGLHKMLFENNAASNKYLGTPRAEYALDDSLQYIDKQNPGKFNPQRLMQIGKAYANFASDKSLPGAPENTTIPNVNDQHAYINDQSAKYIKDKYDNESAEDFYKRNKLYRYADKPSYAKLPSKR